MDEAALAAAKESCPYSDGTYFTDAEITFLDMAEEDYGSLVEGAGVELYAPHYALEAEDKITLAGGISLDEKGRLTNSGSMGRLCPVVINRGGARECVGSAA